MKTTTLTDAEQQLKRKIVAGETPICMHMLGQGLVNSLSNIIRAQTETLHADAAVIAQHAIKLKEIDRLTCNCPCMSVEAQQQFERNKDANAYKCELAGVILKIRAISRSK